MPKVQVLGCTDNMPYLRVGAFYGSDNRLCEDKGKRGQVYPKHSD
jgi:hypothetical protein